MALTVGSVVDGKVTGITKFGAFVEVAEGLVGLVHISEVASTYVRDINDHLKINDIVQVKVLNVEPGGKIGLSIKQAQTPPQPVHHARRERQVVTENAFEDKLARFMKDSNEKLVALKRHQEGRKGR